MTRARTMFIAAFCAVGGALLSVYSASTDSSLAVGHDTKAVTTPTLLQLRVTFQNADEFLPWRFQAPQVRSGYCIALEPDLFLTTEPMVRSARHIEMMLPESLVRHTASVEISDIVLGLALLRTTEPLLDPNYRVTIGTDTPLRGQVSCLQLDGYLRTDAVAGTVLRYTMAQAPGSPVPLLQSEIKIERPLAGAGFPVIDNAGHLVGLGLIYHEGSRTIASITAGGIADFLERARTKPFVSAGYAGFLWEPLLNPAHRRLLDVPARLGVRVLATLPGTEADKTLRADDVILQWNGHDIDAFGFYEHPFFGRQYFTHLISDRTRPGLECRISVWRDGAQQSMTFTLGSRDESHFLIPENTEEVPAEYVIEAGFVFRELSGSYFRAFGSSWRTAADTELVHLYETAAFEAQPPGKRIVILTAVLPDSINVGYQELPDLILLEANGEPVLSLAALAERRRQDGVLYRFRFSRIDADLFVDRDGIPAANRRIALQYGIPSDSMQDE